MNPKHREKLSNLFFLISLIGVSVVFLYPSSQSLLQKVRTHSYVYPYWSFKKINPIDTTALPPAEAVPMLMYHGVVTSDNPLPNTSRRNFIRQMEMLKKNGYSTISVHEYDLFRQGKFELPKRPVLITFDDGRKDSFYPVDDVLKKLGFKATIFIATIKADTNDPFYLNWDELAAVKATGRWEIEAHGKKSHEEVVLNEKGEMGRYLTSRIFTPGLGLESVEEYKQRVENDYVNGINDLKNHLSLDPHYFAVPLNHYGVDDLTNFDGAFEFNKLITKKYFKLAFVESLGTERGALESFYNYKDTDPYLLKRLEVKDMEPENLRKSLEQFTPRTASLLYDSENKNETKPENALVLYGSFVSNNGIVLRPNDSSSSGRLLFGDTGWKDYRVQTTIIRERGRDISLYLYYANEENYIAIDLNEESTQIVQYMNGKETRLADSKKGAPINEPQQIEASLTDGFLSVSINGIKILESAEIGLKRGAVGFGVWDPGGGAEGIVKKIIITPSTLID